MSIRGHLRDLKKHLVKSWPSTPIMEKLNAGNRIEKIDLLASTDWIEQFPKPVLEAFVEFFLNKMMKEHQSIQGVKELTSGNQKNLEARIANFVRLHGSDVLRVTAGSSEGEEETEYLGLGREDTEKSSKRLRMDDARDKAVLLLILVGLPGSGKSTFCRRMLEMCSSLEVAVCNQDELKGKKEECERKALHELSCSPTILDVKLVVIDRTNTTCEQRAEWVKMARRTSIPVIAVWFDVDMSTCIERVKTRQNHPTLKPQQAGMVVSRMAQSFQAPSLQEGFEAVFLSLNKHNTEMLEKDLVDWIHSHVRTRARA